MSATLVETRKGEKVKIFKKIRRQGYRRTRGHRQIETALRVIGITGADGKETKWDGKVDLTTKGELDARARGLAYVSPADQAEAYAASKIQTPRKGAGTAKAAPVEEGRRAEGRRRRREGSRQDGAGQRAGGSRSQGRCRPRRLPPRRLPPRPKPAAKPRRRAPRRPPAPRRTSAAE